mmetsp:Transcript_11626/g.26966  ORF Transcript_11626/g.26966 Transcript_11626/m.26966 type:complete len:211 (-) Transcript_11626:472-1104(-)
MSRSEGHRVGVSRKDFLDFLGGRPGWRRYHLDPVGRVVREPGTPPHIEGPTLSDGDAMLLPAPNVHDPFSVKKLFLVDCHRGVLLRKHTHALVPELPDLVVSPRRQVAVVLGDGGAKVVSAGEEGGWWKVLDRFGLQQVVIVPVSKAAVLPQPPGPNHAVVCHRTRVLRSGRDACHFRQPLDVSGNVPTLLVSNPQGTSPHRHRISTVPP